ncbi:MAG: hypothetical protein ACRELT_02780, partial [Longimicrobiales bacterium]
GTTMYWPIDAAQAEPFGARFQHVRELIAPEARCERLDVCLEREVRRKRVIQTNPRRDLGAVDLVEYLKTL